MSDQLSEERLWHSRFGTALFNLISEHFGETMIFSKRSALTRRMLELVATPSLNDPLGKKDAHPEVFYQAERTPATDISTPEEPKP